MKLKINTKVGFYNLNEEYLFVKVGKAVEDYKKEHPFANVISLGIGDVTLPLPKTVVLAMEEATKEMGRAETLRGYAPSGGYPFLKKALKEKYKARGVDIAQEEIFVTDGAKSTLGAVVSLFENARVLLPTPNYPVYEDLAKIEGFSIEKMMGNEENGFLPLPLKQKKEGYLIFLCSPGNPVGVAYGKEDLRIWVDFAKESGSLILFDTAYEAYLGETGIHSIFEIAGARECAIEIGSFSKDVGFTGVRCGWVVIPKELRDGQGNSLLQRYTRLIASTSNGVSYITQRGAEASLSFLGQQEVKANIRYYLENAAMLKAALKRPGCLVYGGRVSPYLWVKLKEGQAAWETFAMLLEKAELICTPGIGFGEGGEGFVRFSAFGKRESVKEACQRLSSLSFL